MVWNYISETGYELYRCQYAVGDFLKIRRYSALRCAEYGKKMLDTDNRLWELIQIK